MHIPPFPGVVTLGFFVYVLDTVFVKESVIFPVYLYERVLRSAPKKDFESGRGFIEKLLSKCKKVVFAVFE